MKIIENEPIEKYHSEREHLSKSGIDLLLKSPRHYWDKYLKGENEYKPTPAQTLGTMIHEMLLEPELFASKYACGPKGANRNHKIFKEMQEENQDKEILTWSDWQKLQAIKDSAMSQCHARRLLEHGGKNEVSYYWKDEVTDQKLKFRPDRIIDDRKIVIDLKTTENAAFDSFLRKAADFGYHRSVALTSRGLKQITGDDYRYIFLVLETKPPYNAAFFDYDLEDIADADAEIDLAIERFQKCKQLNVWESESSIQRLYIPRWKKMEDA